ncbi:MAG: glycoside hydrolase family 13 protein, partial [Marmoricola sp.]|nr:glycoside hydrolase family 13 protein [Marmoricola sp.]
PRSWADSDGDGMGDLPGITARLPHLADLGVDAVWLSPFYTSPQHDAGYDVADYYDVDPRFGTLDDADALIARAHELGLRVMVDIVPNHSSSEHVWFQEALDSVPGSPARARYVFRDGRGPGGDQPPNNWQSTFGGSAWERVTEADGSPGQWYLHLFDVTQPDFDWTNPEVGDEMEKTLRFWMDRGADGFRIDVAHSLIKADGLPDAGPSHEMQVDRTSDLPMWDQPGVHDVYRRWRRVTDSYGIEGEDADRIMCGEAWVTPPEAMARYVRPDELHQTFNFGFLLSSWIASELQANITESLAVVAPYAATQTWVLSNHDVVRHSSRLGFEQKPGPVKVDGIGADDPQPDAELGLRRARAATTIMLALPGSSYLYQGEELGLPEATAIPDDARQDPVWERSGHSSRGRDGCRVPIPWEGDAPSYGFGPSASSWLPQPEAYGELAVDRQTGVKGSTLELYRTLLRLRREHRPGRGHLTWVDLGQDVLAFDVSATSGRPIRVIANVGAEFVPLPQGAEVLVASGDLDPAEGIGVDTAVWLRLA